MAFDYTLQFWETYEGKRKFFSTRITEPHEFTAETNKYVDEEIADFLNKMKVKNYLNNTIVHLYSDHGDHINFILWETDSGQVEKRNPFYALMIPEKLSKQVKNGRTVDQNLKSNQNRMITHFNLFATDMDYLDGTFSEHVKTGIKSLYSDI